MDEGKKLLQKQLDEAEADLREAEADLEETEKDLREAEAEAQALADALHDVLEQAEGVDVSDVLIPETDEEADHPDPEVGQRVMFRTYGGDLRPAFIVQTWPDAYPEDEAVVNLVAFVDGSNDFRSLTHPDRSGSEGEKERMLDTPIVWKTSIQHVSHADDDNQAWMEV